MLQTIRNAWRLPDVKKKLGYVAFILLLYRIGTVIPVPFIDASNFNATFGNTILAQLDTLSGGSLSAATLFALGISPYITSSIVIQLLTVAIPALERLAKEGEEGKKKINNITRYTTVILAVITAIGYYALLSKSGMLLPEAKVGGGNMWFLYASVIVICFCAGASLVMWLAEKINENGIGNGISLILFANIISVLPSMIIRLVNVSIWGFEAGALMTSKKPSVVVLDLNLPGVDGFELCKKINSSDDFGNPAIIVITALQDSGIEDKIQEMNAVAFFRKPIILDELSQAIKATLS